MSLHPPDRFGKESEAERPPVAGGSECRNEEGWWRGGVVWMWGLAGEEGWGGVEIVESTRPIVMFYRTQLPLLSFSLSDSRAHRLQVLVHLASPLPGLAALHAAHAAEAAQVPCSHSTAQPSPTPYPPLPLPPPPPLLFPPLAESPCDSGPVVCAACV